MMYNHSKVNWWIHLMVKAGEKFPPLLVSVIEDKLCHIGSQKVNSARNVARVAWRWNAMMITPSGEFIAAKLYGLHMNNDVDTRISLNKPVIGMMPMSRIAAGVSLPI